MVNTISEKTTEQELLRIILSGIGKSPEEAGEQVKLESENFLIDTLFETDFDPELIVPRSHSDRYTSIRCMIAALGIRGLIAGGLVCAAGAAILAYAVQTHWLIKGDVRVTRLFSRSKLIRIFDFAWTENSLTQFFHTAKAYYE